MRLKRPSSIARGFVRPAAIGACQESAAGGVRSARSSPPIRPPAIAIARVTVVAGSGIRTDECALTIDPACDRFSAALDAVAVRLTDDLYIHGIARDAAIQRGDRHR